MFVHSLPRLKSDFYVNKTRIEFIVLTSLVRLVLRKNICVFFAILISKSVSRAIFDIELVYFIRNISHTSYILDREKVVFVSFCVV